VSRARRGRAKGVASLLDVYMGVLMVVTMGAMVLLIRALAKL